MTELRNAELALQYRSDLSEVSQTLDSCSDNTRVKFLSYLNENPDESSESLTKKLRSLITAELNPYDNEELNRAFQKIKNLGSKATEEFDQIVNLLPDSVDLDNVVSTLKDKYGRYSDVLDHSPISDESVTQEPAPKDTRSNNSEPKKSSLPNQHSDGWIFNPDVPWRRYAARMLDITLNGTLVWMVIAVIAYQIAPREANNFFNDINPLVDIFLTTLIGCISTGVLIGLTGSSIGKWLFGVRVMGPDGKYIGMKNGISRDISVWVKGLALGIPIASFVTLFMSYRELLNRDTTSWDANKYVILHRPSGPLQYFLNLIGILLYGVILVLMRV